MLPSLGDHLLKIGFTNKAPVICWFSVIKETLIWLKR